jgi:uncharacterized membrane protein (DUF485 family)
MKKWPYLITLLYAVILLSLLSPWVARSIGGSSLFDTWDVALVLIPILALAQFALLRVPVAVSLRRPESRRPLWCTILAATFMMGLLVFGVVISADATLLTLGTSTHSGSWTTTCAIPLGVASWVGWGIYFFKSTRPLTPKAKVTSLQRVLWKGSVLELLVALPIHIFVRNRDTCCASALSFIGLICGFSVMLFAFGPSVYFLFADRWRRLHPDSHAH